METSKFYGERKNKDEEYFVRNFKKTCIGNNEQNKNQWTML